MALSCHPSDHVVDRLFLASFSGRHEESSMSQGSNYTDIWMNKFDAFVPYHDVSHMCQNVNHMYQNVNHMCHKDLTHNGTMIVTPTIF